MSCLPLAIPLLPALALLSLMSALGVGIFRECYSLSKQRCPYSWLRAARDCQEVHPQTPIPASRNPLSLPGMSSKYHRIPEEERLFSRGGTQTSRFHVSMTGSSTISKTMFIQLISSDTTSLPDALSLNPDPQPIPHPEVIAGVAYLVRRAPPRRYMQLRTNVIRL